MNSKITNVDLTSAKLGLEEQVEAAKQGDENAFGHIYDITYDKLLAYTWRRTFDKHASEDIVSNTYIYIIEHISTFEWKSEAAFYGWIYRVTMSELSNYFRKSNRYALRSEYFDQDTIDELVDEEAKAIGQLIDQKDDCYVLHQAIAKLKKKDQRILELYYFADASQKQIAEATKMSEGTVRTRLHRALQKLKLILIIPNLIPDQHSTQLTIGE
jgi:RNA polymerase sigma factor (sigma-70 family)